MLTSISSARFLVNKPSSPYNPNPRGTIHVHGDTARF
jgi:hypothetical protein